MLVCICILQIDEDGNGTISLQELGFALKTVGIDMPGYQLRQLVAQYDINKDETIDMEEFKKVWTARFQKHMCIHFVGICNWMYIFMQSERKSFEVRCMQQSS